MKTLQQWREFTTSDPDWQNLKYIWGSGRKMADPRLVTRLKLKIEAIKQEILREKAGVNPSIRDFGDLPVADRDSLAQALVIAVLKTFYQDDAGTGRAVDPRMLGKTQQQTPAQAQPNLPQNNIQPPQAWQG
jgi:hypothetical protein